MWIPLSLYHSSQSVPYKFPAQGLLSYSPPEENLCWQSVFCGFHPAQQLSTTGKKMEIWHFSSDILLPI